MADLLPPLGTAQTDGKTKVDEKVDYSNLPCPVPYEELHREAISLVFLIYYRSTLFLFLLLSWAYTFIQFTDSSD